MDAKLKAKAMTDDQLDGVAGGRVIMDEEACMQVNEARLELRSKQEVNNETRRELSDLLNSKGTENKQPTLNTYSLKYL